MRLPVIFLLALPALFSAETWAQASLNKCIDAQGKVTYSNLPCRNSREVRAVEIDPAPRPDPARPALLQVEPAKPSAPKAANSANETATLHRETRPTTGKPAAAHPSARQCDALTDNLGRVFDKMDQARRKGYSQEQMNTWNREAKDLERKKREAGCF